MKYKGSKLDKLVVEENSKRRKQVKDGLNKVIARLPGEKSARAVYNLLPKAVKEKGVREEVVYKFLALLDKSDLRRKVKDENEFKEEVRNLLDSEEGHKWMNAWLQPDDPTDGAEPELPSLPSSPKSVTDPSVTNDGNPGSPPESKTIIEATKSPTVNAPTKTEVVSLEMTQLLSLPKYTAFQRRRASDSSLVPLFLCHNCGQIHQNTYRIIFEMPSGEDLMESNIAAGGVTSHTSGPALVRNMRTSGPIYNRLVMVLFGMFVASIMILFAFYKFEAV